MQVPQTYIEVMVDAKKSCVRTIDSVAAKCSAGSVFDAMTYYAGFQFVSVTLSLFRRRAQQLHSSLLM